MRALLWLLPAFALSCGKTPVGPPIQWEHDLAKAQARALAEHKQLFIFVGAEWDASSKELMEHTFTDSAVRDRIYNHYVPLFVDVTDTDDPEVERLERVLEVKGTPMLVIESPLSRTSSKRFYEFVPAPKLLAALE